MSFLSLRAPGTLRRLALACALGGSGLALADSQPLNLDLPGQSLEATVHALAHESGVAIAADSRLLAGRSAPALQGRYTVLQALRQLLAGSDLMAVEERGVIILRGPAEAGALTLGATTVNASGFNSDLPESYSGGQVARGARIGMLGNRDLMDTPFSVTAYTAKTIENQQSGTVGAVLRNDPSIRFSTGEGHAYENFMIRGYALDSTELALGGLYGLAPDGHVPTEFLERVEVLKGPGALLNGMAPNGGVGGVVNLVPKRAGDTPLTRLTTSYVSDGYVAEHLDVGRRFAEGRFGIRFNGVYGSGDTGVDEQSKDRTLAALALDYRGDDFKLELDAYESHEKLENGSPMMAGFTGLNQVTRAPKPDTNILEGIHARQISKAVVVRGEYQLDDHWSAYASVGGARTRYDGFLNGTRVVVDKADGSATGETYNQAGYTHSLSSEAGLRGDFMTGPVSHQLVLSTTLLHQDIGRAPTVTGPKYPTNIYQPGKAVIAGNHGSSTKTGDNTLSSFAVADTLGFLDERVLLTLGVRSQRVRQKMSSPAYDERKLTPAVGIVLKPWDAPVSLYANYIEGLTQGGMVTDVRAANYREQFAPYVAKQMEAGVKWDLGDFTHTLALFQIEKPSMIYDKPSNRYTDDGEQRNRGVEWTMFGEVVPSVRLLGGVTYTRAVLSKTAGGSLDGNTARGVPAWSANLGAEWDLPWVEGLTLTALGIHSSSQYLDSANQLKIPQWTRYDLGARYATKVLSKDVTLRASLENVENRAYWAGVFNDGYATVSEPRTLKLSASVDF
ncbi:MULTISPECIES: TonB-dependent receptor [unclassified Pseudomonas]|uniref:TonB-dependent receptor n=1 Tax=unclassified Pseudomonas TaxID=196821 RepID=UPI00244B6E9D|nr:MULTISPECIES: TonB-dependent receptor [unclassified Pseudomonas]MDH0303510.1 TonB-dependent receptor [Pseudomonas sp. GD04091]MDH1987300.1 TonB-dependent receptor [Pseudomonas sp. GD03689]